LRGAGDRLITGVGTLAKAGPAEVSFLSNRRYRRYLAETRAAAVILAAADADHCPVAALVTANPYLAYARAAQLLSPAPPRPGGVHPSAVVSPTAAVHPSAWVGPQCVVEDGATVGPGVFLGPACVVGAGAVIGDGSRLVARVTVCHGCRIGQGVILHPGVVIGADGFGLAKDGETWVKIPQLGAVVLEDDVEVGANSTIDRGALEDTVVEQGVKIDNQVQVGHNCRIGAHTAIAGCVGIAGSARIGRRCILGGAAGVAGHLEIADDVTVTAMGMVTKSITEPGSYSSGTPMAPTRDWKRSAVRFSQLDSIQQRLAALEKQRTDRN